ncbi:MAG: phosphomannomutase/phosphoglucomutase [Acidobacteriota bacterium]|nr:phosphomannomutase/phosphoglucomutase [Acidobacteriota bacterium]
MLKSNIFREYDIRGVADAELPDAGITELGQAIGTYMQRRHSPKIMLARDCRLSSERLRNALIAGLKATGCHVTDIGVVPTPLLYYSVFHFKSGGGVMITGSHNPAEYNGFKIVSGSSTIHGEEIQRLRQMIGDKDFADGQGSEQFADAITPYVDEISSQFHFDRRIKVVVDAGNGTGGPAFHRILDKLNVDASELFFDMDGRFPNHHPDPTVPKNLDALVKAVLEKGADLGIAFDGDADRIGAVDDKGAVIYGDQLLTIYAREILSRKPGATIIGEVKCSQQMYDDIRQRGGNGIMWKTGHSLIKSKMKETHAELAGEMSGHMFFADRYYGFDDALYAACRLMEIVSKSGQPLSAQLADLEKTVTTPEIRVDCEDEAKFQVVERVTGHFKKLYEVLEVDGARINFPHGWGLVRASNTQPVLVLRFEATTQQILDGYRAEVENAVRAAR